MSFYEDLATAIHRLELELGNLNKVAAYLGVDRAGLKRFIDGERGLRSQSIEKILDTMGAKILFKGDLIDSEKQETPSLFDQKVAQVLREVAKTFGLDAQTLCKEAFDETIPVDKVREMLNAERIISADALYRICRALDISPSKPLERAAELAEQERLGATTDRDIA